MYVLGAIFILRKGKGVGGFGSSLRKKRREELRDFDVVFES